MTVVYGDSTPSCTMVFEWARRFKDGQLNIEDSPRSGRPISSTDEKNIKAIENLVVEDRRITIQEIAKILGISSGTVHGILHDHVHMTKVCSTWVPHLQRLFKNMNELKHVKNFWLAMKKKEMICFLVLSLVTSHCSITINMNQNNGNELTLHHQRSLSKRSQNAVLYSFFWDYNVVILKEPVPAGTTVTNDILCQSFN